MSHFVLLDEEHNVVVVGKNHKGQLGLGDTENRHLPVKLSTIGTNSIVFVSSVWSTDGKYTFFLDDQGYVWISGHPCFLCPQKTIPTKLENVKNIINISLSVMRCFFLDDNGIVFNLGFSSDNDGILTVPTKIENIPKIKEIHSGAFHSILIDVDGNCWSFGINMEGQLGLGDKIPKSVPTKISISIDSPISSAVLGTYHTIILDIYGRVYSCGSNGNGQLGYHHFIDDGKFKQIDSLPTIKSVHCGSLDTFAIDLDGNVWAFGHNEWGQLGLGHNVNVVFPTKLAFEHGPICNIICSNASTIMITNKGDCFSCGNNKYGQLGLGHTNDVNVPTKIENLKAKVTQPLRFIRTKSSRN
jgi:alpha-tubulin suppressor-like RCC1 family protein